MEAQWTASCRSQRRENRSDKIADVSENTIIHLVDVGILHIQQAEYGAAVSPAEVGKEPDQAAGTKITVPALMMNALQRSHIWISTPLGAGR